MKNILLRYHVLKTLVNLLGLFEWLAGGYGLISFTTKEVQGWQFALAALISSYLISCELGYYVSRLQIRLELKGDTHGGGLER